MKRAAEEEAVIALNQGAGVTAVPRGEEGDKAAVPGPGDSTYDLGRDGDDVTSDGELGPGRAPLDDAVAHVDVPGSRDPTVGPGSGRVTLNGTAVPDDVPGPDQARSNDALIHSVATVVPIFRQSPYRDHFQYFGPYFIILVPILRF